jgi:hypothetical protein
MSSAQTRKARSSDRRLPRGKAALNLKGFIILRGDGQCFGIGGVRAIPKQQDVKFKANHPKLKSKH